MVNQLNKRLKIFSFLAVLLLIVTVFSLIAYITVKEKKAINSNNEIDRNIEVFWQNTSAMFTQEDKKSAEYSKAYLGIKEVKKVKDIKEKYNEFRGATIQIQILYSNTNHSYLYKILNNGFATFAKENFKDQYQDVVFNYPCQDPTCSKSKIPKEITEIVEYIKTTNLSEEYKKSFIQNLINTSYENLDDFGIAASYHSTALSLESLSRISDFKDSLIIAQKIREYLSKHYSKEYSLLLASEKKAESENK